MSNNGGLLFSCEAESFSTLHSVVMNCDGIRSLLEGSSKNIALVLYIQKNDSEPLMIEVTHELLKRRLVDPRLLDTEFRYLCPQIDLDEIMASS